MSSLHSIETSSVPVAPPSRPSSELLLSVALLAAAVLAFEVALTRVFSVVLRYHFAFLMISIAVCGLGVGGYAAHWLRARKPLPLPALSAAFAISIVGALWLLLRVVFPNSPDAYWLLALIVLVPFSLAGAFLAEAFAAFPAWSGRLYAWDLAGASLAAVAVVGLLQSMSAPAACLMAAIIGSIPAFLLTTQRRFAMQGLAVPLLLAVVWGLNGRFNWFDVPPLPPKVNAEGMSLADRGVTQPLFTELGMPNSPSRIVETRWNAFARTDVVDDKQSPGSLLLYTNGNVPTNMMQWSGYLSTVKNFSAQFPLSDWCFDVASLNKSGSKVLSIGPGGGLDALLALHHGAKRFDGAEINPSIIDIMRDYRKYNGGIYERPDVRVEVADGRAFVHEKYLRGERYDLIYSALTKTATAGQGMALLESFIYTENAFDDYWQTLTPDGQVTIVLDNPLLLARFTATMLQVMKARGIDNKAAMNHIALMYNTQPGPYVFALVVQKSPFTRQQTFALIDAAVQRRLTSIWIPNQAALSNFGPYPAISAGTLDQAGFVKYFRDQANLDVSPLPDNRPFVLDLSLATLPVFQQMTGVALFLGIGLAVLGLLTSAPSRSLEPAGEAPTPGNSLLWILYFLALGVGFMLVEIPLIQKLILPLGYPTLSLTVILFAILLGGGVGSWFSQRFEGVALARWASFCAVAVAVMAVILTVVIGNLQNWFPLLPLLTRCVISAALLFPLGFLLGTPFPSGIRLFAHTREAQVPLIWGLNGVASVVGSLCAAMGAKAWGFTQMVWVGALVYVAAAALLWMLGQESRPAATAALAGPDGEIEAAA